jgi:hypothetical protein
MRVQASSPPDIAGEGGPDIKEAFPERGFPRAKMTNFSTDFSTVDFSSIIIIINQ